MKKLIFSAAVLASAFFAASCQQEMLDPQAEGTTVTYTVEVPDAIATKATGDGFTLHYEVYRQGDLSNLDADPIYEGTETFSGGKADVQLEFVKDQEFKVLFWAQQTTGAQAYNITDLRKVSLKTLVANDLTAEVFAGNDHVVDCKSDKNGNVVLVRPVAQLNIATTAESFTLGTTGSTEATVVPTQSKVVVNGLYGTYNVADGTVDTKASRTYTAYAVPRKPFKEGTYELMATNYLGFIPQAGDNVEVKFTIYTEKDGNIEHTVSNVPVKANYQTNILGNLISATADYQVTLEDWADAGKDMEVLADGIVKNINGDYEISTAKGLAYAICNVFANGGTFYVLKNIDMTGVSYDPADVPAGTTVHIVGETPVVTRSTGSVEITGLTKPLLKTVQNGAAASFANIYIDAPIDFVQTNNGVVAFNNCDNTATDSEDDLVGDNTNGTIESVLTNNMALQNALAAEAPYIKLAGDVDVSDIIVLGYNVTIDGCGHKLTSTAGRAINVSGADGVTIKNLVINCSGERAINIIQNADNVTIDNVTATAANYTVNVALSAPGAVVKIENCTLNGLNTVNVASPGAEVTVDNSTINCNDNNTTAGEAYSALCLNKAAVGAEIIATNTIVNVTEGSDSSKGRNGAEDGTVTINDSTKDVTVTIAVITYPGSDNYYGFETVASAIKFAKETDVISLIRNISVEETIVVNADKTVTIDLNGKTITGTMPKSVGAVVENNGTLTIQNGTINSIAINGGSAILNKGTLTLNNVNVNGAPTDTATGTASYAVNTEGAGSKLTVNNSNISGRGAIGATEGTKVELNGGTYHTPAVAWGHAVYATNEGTEVVINDGIFSEGYEMAANNWGMYQICSIENAKVIVNGGTFEAWDCANGYDLHTASEGTIEIYGGAFAENPSSQNGKNYVANGYKAVQKADGKWEVVAKTYVAQGEDEAYESLQEAFNAGGTITLLCDVMLTEMAVLESGKTATLDLNGYNITVPEAEKHIYAINNKGNLTLKDSKGTGSVKARGIYNGNDGAASTKMTVMGGNYFGIDTDGGAAIMNYAELVINGGEFYGAACAVNNKAATAQTTIYNGKFGGAYQDNLSTNYVIQNNAGTLIVNYAEVVSGFGAIGAYGGTTTIKDGSFLPIGWAGYTCHVVYVAAAADVTINGGTYKMNYAENAVPDSGSAVASYYNGTLSITGGTFYAHFDHVSPVELSKGSSITGGTYYNHAGAVSQHNYIKNFVAEGYELNANGEVVKK